jgi:epoxyqueuosine reductase
LKDELPSAYKNKFEDWMFGCDICQDVCPWNRFSTLHTEEKLKPHRNLLAMNKQDWEEITSETFNLIFKKSAVKRTKYAGLIRNISFLKK